MLCIEDSGSDLNKNDSENGDDYGSEEDDSEMESGSDFDKSGAMHSKMSIVKLTNEEKEFLSLSLFIQMEHC